MTVGPAPSLGWQVCDWIETMLCHGPGSMQGKPWVLDAEQRLFIYRLYELEQRANGRWTRRYRRAMLCRPKGWAKTTLSAAVGCAELLGPVVFDGWDADRDPVGRRRTRAVNRSVATEENQSGLSFDAGAYMLGEGRAVDEYDLDVGKTRVLVADGSNSNWEMTTSSPNAADGGQETCTIYDESHLHRGRLVGLHQTRVRNLRKTGWDEPGIMLEPTTAWAPGEYSVAEATAEAAKHQDSILLDMTEVDPEIDVEDHIELLAGLRKAYGLAAERMDLEAIIQDEFEACKTDPNKSIHDAKRYFLGIPSSSEHKLVKPALWDPLERELEVPLGARITVGFDGSVSRDSTVLVGWWLDGPEGPHRFAIESWSRPDGEAGIDYKVPRAEVRAVLESVFEDYRVELMFKDPSKWYTEMSEWQKLWGVSRVVGFEAASRPKDYNRFIEVFQSALSEGQFTHDGGQVDEEMQRQVYATKTRRSGRFLVLDKASESVLDRTDGGVATLLGFAAAAEVLGSGGGALSVSDEYKKLMGIDENDERAPVDAGSDGEPVNDLERERAAAYGW